MIEMKHQYVEVSGGTVHVVDAGPPKAPALVFVHGWPESWKAYEAVMELAAQRVHAVAIDLPGIGGSRFDEAPGDKFSIALILRELFQKLGLNDLTLVGHDIGAHVIFAYLVNFPGDIRRAVLMDGAIPGTLAWADSSRNRNDSTFGFHSIATLPETIAPEDRATYFDTLYAANTAHPEHISPELRAAHVEAYSDPSAFGVVASWYRTLGKDATANSAKIANSSGFRVPLLYLRGDKEGGDIEQYVESYRAAGFGNVIGNVIANCGHYGAEEQPEAVWAAIDAFTNPKPVE